MNTGHDSKNKTTGMGWITIAGVCVLLVAKTREQRIFVTVERSANSSMQQRAPSCAGEGDAVLQDVTGFGFGRLKLKVKGAP